MTATAQHYRTVARHTGSQPAWAEVWHLWRIIIPRRSITGRLVFNRVWRRRDGGHWIYKKFTEYAPESPDR